MLRGLALCLTALTGMSGLVYEVTWERYLAILVGSHAEATAAVLGLFLGGLSLGYSRFGAAANRLIRDSAPEERGPRLLRLYGWVEAGIGVYALAFPWLFSAARFLSTAVPPGGSGVAEALAFGFDVGLCAALIVPGAFLMGATIPLLTQALAVDLDDATRVHARIYAFNTFGAVAGALGGGFVLLPTLGLVGSLQVMAILNLFAGACFVAMSSRASAIATPEPETQAEGQDAPDLALYSAIGLLAGFAMMTLQTVVIRLSGLSFGASPYTFPMVVAVFVLGIALGSFAIGSLAKVPCGALALCLWIQTGLLVLLYTVLDDMPWMAYALRGFFRSIDPAFPAFVAGGLALVAALVGPAAIFSGATLPLVFHELRDRFGELGAAAGSLYSWNTVGSLLGALLGGYALFFWLDLDGVYRTALLTLVVAASLATWRGLGRSAVAAALCVSATLGLALLPEWSEEMLSAGLFRQRHPPLQAYEGPEYARRGLADQNILLYDDDPVASIKVIELDGPLGMSRSIFSNGKSDGNTLGDFSTMSLAGLLPAVLGVETPTHSFVIGFGTGVTAGELAALPGMERVVVAEISTAVAAAAPFFDFANQNASANPKLEMIRSDAYRALQRSEHRYDVIVSEPSNPWMAGVEMLFTHEFLSAARDRLTPGGIYVQWYHQYETSDEAIALVLRTYLDVFDRVAVWYGKGADLLLFGMKGEGRLPGPAEIQRRMRKPGLREALSRSGIDTLAALIAHELLPEGTVLPGTLEGPLHHLTHPRLGFEAGRAFFRGGEARLPYLGAGEAGQRGRKRALLPRLLERLGGDAGLREQVLHDYALELCSERKPECIATLAAWESESPASPMLARVRQHVLRRGSGAVPGVTAGHLRRARWLHAPLPADAPESLSARELEQAGQLYLEAYHHARPFAAGALRTLWTRCKDEAGACERGRSAAQRSVSSSGIQRTHSLRERRP